MLDVGSAFHVPAARMVDENAAHRLGRHGKEVGAVLPVHALVVDEPHVGFVDERRRLQAVAGALTSQAAPGETAKLVVDDRRQLGERALVPVAPRTEKRADVGDRFTKAPALMHGAHGRSIRGLHHFFV